MEEEGKFDYLDRDPHEINRYLTVKIEKNYSNKHLISK